MATQWHASGKMFAWWRVPGPGKTRVLIERFAWLVEERDVDPSRILAITFTEKAATEIKQTTDRPLRGAWRICGKRWSVPGSQPSMASALACLRENAIAAGLRAGFYGAGAARRGPPGTRVRRRGSGGDLSASVRRSCGACSKRWIFRRRMTGGSPIWRGAFWTFMK